MGVKHAYLACRRHTYAHLDPEPVVADLGVCTQQLLPTCQPPTVPRYWLLGYQKGEGKEDRAVAELPQERLEK